MTKIRVSKLLSFLLCFVMIATTFGQVPMIASATESDSSQLTIQMDGKDVNEAELTKDDNVELTVAGTGDGDVQWQYYAAEYKMWINIYGETADKCVLTYAKVCNMLDDNDQTVIRCTQKDGDKSNEVTVTVGESIDKTESAASTYAVRRSAAKAAASNYNVTPQADDEEQKTTYSIVINYLFENNEIASDPWTATIAKGTSFSRSVDSPVVQGYLPYIDNDQKNSVELNYGTDQVEDVTINVVYKPTNVDYTVIHYQQNVDDDKYTEVERETKQGLTKSIVPDVAKKYDGFYALLYEKPAIAADGSTVVEVYYDRYYYLMNFDLDGGYGVEPIYARYGTPISGVGTPTKAGYSFEGWSLNGENASLPDTMPAENRTYKAVWKANDTAKVTVVFWGENADDEEYSYIKSTQVNVKPGTEFTYSESGSLVCGQEVHTHDASCGYACGQEEHSHNADCYQFVCTQEEHTHSNSCYTCGKESHTHAKGCYAGVGSASSAGIGAPSNPSNGYVAREAFSFDGKVIYINGTWYKYTGSTSTGNIAPTTCGKTEETHTHTDTCLGCGKTEHTHTDYTGECYTLTCTTPEHTHFDACGYNCGKTAHTHTSDCYMSGAGLDSNLWTFVRSDTVTVAADGSTVVNVYYDRTEKTLTYKYNYERNNYQTTEKITAKWGSNISEQYKDIASNAGSTFWSAKTGGGGPYTNYFGIMPQTSATYYNRGGSGSTGTMTYWGQDLNGDYTVKLFEVTGVGGYTVTVEDRYEFAGYTYDHGTNIGSSCSGAKFYYTRNSYNLSFNDGYNDVKSESVKYEAPLSTYSSYVPDAPSAYEAGSVTFGGWYLNPECTGQQYKLDLHTMPADNLLLYAKWVPVQHTVDFYLDNDALDNNQKLEGYTTLTVNHGEKVSTIPATPENGSYTFVGWFYMEVGVEKAFDFANMPVNKDLQVYGKWSSNVLKEYTIYYKYRDSDGNEIEIADPTKGGTLAGITKTFEAKGGTELYTDYQEGYFPLVKSHSMTMDINATKENDTNVYTFWYVQKDAVPYTVKYLNKATGKPVADQKTVSDNRKAVVTETFVPVSGMLPDAYQKRLVVSAEDGAVNEIIFYYTEDTTHAYYKITHYTENLATDAQGNPTWTEYASSQAVGNIGEIYTAYNLNIPGFTCRMDSVSGELTADGLELNLYYERNSYPYQVRYLEEGTSKVLADPIDKTGKYGEVVSESAIDITNYQAVTPTPQTLSIRIEESQTEAKLNIITFYYREKEATINYQVVGPDGCGTLSPTSEALKVISGRAYGSTPTANENFRFVGWFTDEACMNSVTETQVDSNNKFTPAKSENDVWVDGTTYYAKFEYALKDLTIRKIAPDDTDSQNQTFIFNVKGNSNDNRTKDIDMTVTIKGSGSVVIKDLPVGNYTVTEDTNWSWRYSADKASKDYIIASTKDNIVEFVNTINPDKTKWLNSITNKINDFAKAIDN